LEAAGAFDAAGVLDALALDVPGALEALGATELAARRGVAIDSSPTKIGLWLNQFHYIGESDRR